jgi:dTDP-4-amino-4,6-dideoxygalactose transaminase
VTEAISRKVVSLPMDGYMTEARINRVIDAVKTAV